MISRCPTSLPGVKPADGLPPVLNTEMLGAPHGGYVPAAFNTLHEEKWKMFETVSSIAQTFRSSSRTYIYDTHG